MEERDDVLSDPTGGPSAGSESTPEEKGDEPVDLSAEAGGQDEDKGAVEEATEQTEDEPNPG